MAGGIRRAPVVRARGRPIAGAIIPEVPRGRFARARGGCAVTTWLHAGRAIRELPAAERPRERLALRGVGGLTRPS